jgi:hypothetical protein
MANTTNYNWETPDDTDLVKDGAAAIRTLGSSIDTTTKNLNPQTTTGALAYRSATANVNTALPLGTANQVLRVNSGGTAPEWATTADQTPLTTKGDLFGFDTADARIPIGTNGHILTADSTQSLGLKWAAPAATAFNGAQVKKSVAQSTGAGGVTTITFDQENYDTNSYHDNVTNNSRLTVPTTGYYRFTINTGMANYPVGVNEFLQIRLYKNGSQVQASLTQYIASFDAQATAGDYFEFVYYNDLAQSLNGTFSVEFLGA